MVLDNYDFRSDFKTWRFSKIQTRERILETLSETHALMILNVYFRVTPNCPSLWSEGLPTKALLILEPVVILHRGNWFVEFGRGGKEEFDV
jgi:hypothetical protein